MTNEGNKETFISWLKMFRIDRIPEGTYFFFCFRRMARIKTTILYIWQRIFIRTNEMTPGKWMMERVLSFPSLFSLYFSYIYIYISRSWLAHPSASYEHGGIHDSSGVSSPSWRKRATILVFLALDQSMLLLLLRLRNVYVNFLQQDLPLLFYLSSAKRINHIVSLPFPDFFFFLAHLVGLANTRLGLWFFDYYSWIEKKGYIYFHSLWKRNRKRFAKTISFFPPFFLGRRAVRSAARTSVLRPPERDEKT